MEMLHPVLLVVVFFKLKIENEIIKILWKTGCQSLTAVVTRYDNIIQCILLLHSKMITNAVIT